MEKSGRTHSRPRTLDFDAMEQWDQKEIFAGFWDELLAMDPREVCRRSLASYRRDEEVYALPLLDRTCLIGPSKRTILLSGGSSADASPSFAEALIPVIYLISASDVPLSGRQITEKELPGGNLFFHGPHELTRKPVLSRYEGDPDAFLAAGLALGGRRIPSGDAGIHLQALPRVPIEYILWAADDEFPSSLSIVFDATVSDHLPLDAIWAVVHFVTSRLAEADK